MDVRRIDPKRPTLWFDTECAKDYWLISFLNEAGRVVSFERFERFEDHPLDRAGIAYLFKHYRLISFNGNKYDLIMVTAAMAGYSCLQLKHLNDRLIVMGEKTWDLERATGLEIPKDIDHIDLIEPAFGRNTGLKLYGGRIHSKRLQDLPFDPDASIAVEQRPVVRRYCENDLQTTRGLYNVLLPDLALRERMSIKYGIDLRSKSDAQMGEAIIKSFVERKLGQRVYRTEIPPGSTFTYGPPSFISFTHPSCIEAFERIKAAEFVIRPNGQPWVPAWGEEGDDGIVAGAPIVRIGSGVYRMGYGGLHSSEKQATWYTDADNLIDDDDVPSYYPEIIKQLKLAPSNMRGVFEPIFAEILDTRLKAKLAGDKDTAQTLKIAANGGGFGKTGSVWSAFYAPDMMITVTLTGQLCLLMLVEAFERYGIPVISANTDGILTRVPNDKRELKQRIIKRWSEITGFGMETNHYKAVFSRDVNNYLALKFKHNDDGSWDFTKTDGFKGKGAYNDATTVEAKLSKNPNMNITIDAVRAFLEYGVPLRQTIRDCQDVRKFLVVRQVNGGALYKGEFLGKVVRWYHAIEGGATIHYRTLRYTKAEREFHAEHGFYEPKIGNKVPMTDNCKPLMELPDELPKDIDYPHYINKAVKILYEIGYT